MPATFKAATRDKRALIRALDEANIAPMLALLAQLSGDMDLLEEAAPHIEGAWPHMQHVPDALRVRVRDHLVQALEALARNHDDLPPANPPASTLLRIMAKVVGQEVPPEYLPLMVEETGMASEDLRAVRWRTEEGEQARENFHVIIIGAGFSGITAAIRLKQAGIPFIVIEKNATAGGTWHENRYPGCGVDTVSHFYSFSFRPNNDWSHYFAKRDEIHQYIEETVDHFGVRERMMFNQEVVDMVYDDILSLWTVTTRSANGEQMRRHANVVISAVGLINRPSIPDIPGLDGFKGPVVHTANWDSTQSFEGKRVALIGTGASGMQVGPTLASQLRHLAVFQRSPHWVNHNPLYHSEVQPGQRWALKHIPMFSEWQRFLFFWGSSDGLHASLKIDPDWHLPALSLNAANHRIRQTLVNHIERELHGNAALIAKCTPDYPPYGKRMLRDNHWYKMLLRDNVSLVTDPISHINEDAVVTTDGAEHEVDAIVMATGFHAGKMLWPMEVRASDGTTIRDIWGDDDPRAYKGITVPGFPNLFLTSGPNTGLAHGGSHFFHSECQINYIADAIRHMIENRLASVEVRQDAHDTFNEQVDSACANMVWAHPGVKSWYKNAANRVTIISPWRLLTYWEMTRTFDANVYHCTALPNRDGRARSDVHTARRASRA